MPSASGRENDYARRLALDLDALDVEIANLSSSQTEAESPDPEGRLHGLEPGISIVIPTYQGAGRIAATVESLAAQDIPHTKYELLVVPNGPDDGTTAVLDKLARRYPTLTIRVLTLSEASAGAARNMGIKAARRRYLTFVDDDDYVQRRFLGAMLDLASDDAIVIAPIVDAHADGTLDDANSLNTRIADLQRHGDVPVSRVPWALGFNACKLIPTQVARKFEYDSSLSSGEDLVYMAHFATVEGLVVRSVSEVSEAAYVRSVRQSSVSRKGVSYEHLVMDRVRVIQALRRIPLNESPAAKGTVDALVRAQVGFIRRYIETHPEERSRVSDAIQAAAIAEFPWEIVNRDQAKDLAISYCFAPFSDTSAVVAAKAIAERRRYVDVVTCDMSEVRRKDPAVSALADRWISERHVIPARPSFVGWDLISEFSDKAIAVADRQHALRGGYETVYSRALWVGSHVAAALFKLRHWQVHWTAEFSDPLRTDAEGRARPGTVSNNETTSRLRRGVASRGYGHLLSDSVFELVEVSTFVLADELIFTNSNQRDYMLSMLDDRKLRGLVYGKSIVREHPEPDASAYDMVQSGYRVPEGVVNLAYFGSFYANRGLGDVLTAIANLTADVRRRVRLHIFCNQADNVRAQVASYGVAANVYVNDYLPYMEFLNATRKFDVLVVNDVERGDDLPINPFLPSKLSDYKGSGRPIWALVDEGSPLSRASVSYTSTVGDAVACISVLEQIVRDSIAAVN